MMETGISDEDLLTIQALRNYGVLEDTDSNHIPRNNGTLMVTCADADRIGDMIDHHRACCSSDGCHHRHHHLSLNGGSLLIPDGSPARRSPSSKEGEVLLQHINDGCALKQIHTIILYAHTPCGIARLRGITLLDTLRIHVAAKDCVRACVQEGTTIVLFFHIDYGEKKRTYFFNRPRWTAYLGKNYRI